MPCVPLRRCTLPLTARAAPCALVAGKCRACTTARKFEAELSSAATPQQLAEYLALHPRRHAQHGAGRLLHLGDKPVQVVLPPPPVADDDHDARRRRLRLQRRASVHRARVNAVTKSVADALRGGDVPLAQGQRWVAVAALRDLPGVKAVEPDPEALLLLLRESELFQVSADGSQLRPRPREAEEEKAGPPTPTALLAALDDGAPADQTPVGKRHSFADEDDVEGPWDPHVAAQVLEPHQLGEVAARHREANPELWTTQVRARFGRLLQHTRNVARVRRIHARGDSETYESLGGGTPVAQAGKQAVKAGKTDGAGRKEDDGDRKRAAHATADDKRDTDDDADADADSKSDVVILREDFAAFDVANRWKPGPVKDNSVVACYKDGHRGVREGCDFAVKGSCVLELRKSTAPQQPYNLAGLFYRLPKGRRQPRRLAFSVRVTRNDRRTGHVALGSRARVAATAAWFIMRANGRMGLFGGDHVGYVEVANYVPHRWYRIEMLLDWTEHVVQLFVDGRKMTDDVPFVGAACTEVTMLMVDTVDADVACYFDDMLLEG